MLNLMSIPSVQEALLNGEMILYETCNERMLIPATSEGFKFVERMMSGHTSDNIAMAR